MQKPAQAISRTGMQKGAAQAAPISDQSTSSRTTAADETFTLRALASQLACAANGFSLFTGALFRWLFIVATHLHFAEDTFALHLFLESAESLINIVIADEYLHV
ncbi:hypothetical protein D9M69_600920 [compost metagenome]